jgi:NitT/TauT family transport system permease protein
MMRYTHILAPVFGALSILAAWQFLLPLSDVPAYIAPTPAKIIAVFFTQTDLILSNFLPTATEALAGFFFGNLAAVMFAILFAYARFIRMAYFPVVLFFNTIPILALSPIIILIFGLGMTPKIIIAAIICFFPTLVNMIRGLASATPQRGRTVPYALGHKVRDLPAAASAPFFADAVFIAPHRHRHGRDRCYCG